jgi:glycosyltransferase involved in cell wall biosynthesis
MKIGIITPADLPVPAVHGGAIETLISNFIKENEKQGLHELVVYSKYNEIAFHESKNFSKTIFHWVKNSWHYIIINFLFRLLRKIGITSTSHDVRIVYQFIKKDHPDVILVEGNPAYVKYLKKRLDPGCRILFHIHALLNDGKYKYLNDAFEFSDEIFVVSEYIKSNLLERFQVNINKVKVVYNCANEIYFNYKVQEDDLVSMKNRLGIGLNDFVLIFAGRLVPEKGLLELVKACKLLKNRITFKLLIAGSFGSDFGKTNSLPDPFKEVIQAEILDNETNFRFCGYISNDRLVEYYCCADLAIFPSVTEEAAGLVAIEAMALSLPIIYSNRGGIPEYVSAECGIMVDMKDKNCIEQIAGAILTLHDDHEIRKGMSSASFQNAKRFTPEKYYENLSEYIDLSIKSKKVGEVI